MCLWLEASWAGGGDHHVADGGLRLTAVLLLHGCLQLFRDAHPRDGGHAVQVHVV